MSATRVLEYQGHEVALNTKTGKFVVPGFPEEHDTLLAAKAAIAKFVKASRAIKRRPVIVFDNRHYYDEDSFDRFQYAELTSFSAHRYGRNLHANVVRNKEREEVDPDNVYEDTAANRQHVARVNWITKEIATLEKEKAKILQETMARVEVPSTKEDE